MNKKILQIVTFTSIAFGLLYLATRSDKVVGAADGSSVAIDSEPILRVNEIAIDSEPILREDPKAIDSEPILREELTQISMFYKKNGKYTKMTYKPVKAEAMDDKEGKKREEKGQVQRLRKSKK